jgi:nitrogen fixation NifU-like protein
MADSEDTSPVVQPVTFFGELSRDELEKEMASRAAGRFSKNALRAALFPQHLGELAQPDGYAHAHGKCGDLITFYLRIVDTQIAEITFTTDGCDATIACGETLASLVTGSRLENAMQITTADLLVAMDGLPPRHIHCADLAIKTLHTAIASYREDGKA